VIVGRPGRQAVVGVLLLGASLLTAAEPAPPVTPPEDPQPREVVELLPELADAHPRLLCTAEELRGLRSAIAAERKPAFEKLLRYLDSSAPPNEHAFLHDATEGQRQGLWRMPTVALHYALTGEERSFARAKAYLDMLLDLEHWELGREQDAGMSAANIMVGAALCYDWLYNELDPRFRDRFRDKLLLQARRMYHRGHLMQVDNTHYWQNDPQNNHRWHRDAGLVLAALAVADAGDPADDWLLAQALEELRFVHRWLPADGSSHESPSYMIFGLSHLMLAASAADRCLGTDFIAHPFYRTVADFRLHTLTPGFTRSFGYGDSAPRAFGAYNHACYLACARHRLADRQAGLRRFQAAQPKAFWIGWFELLWFDPSLQGGSLAELPTAALFPDIGLACIRDGWETEDVALCFKSAPYGGFALNRYRNEHDYHYINVAHDDPDANSFMLYTDRELVIRHDSYAYRKLSSSHNTILVDGAGQLGEGEHWTQPLGGERRDMSGLARICTWKQDDGVTVVEGEAGGAYAALDRYRRSMLWVEGRYLLVLDHIAGPRRMRIDWLLQSAEVQALPGVVDGYRLSVDERGVAMRLRSVPEGTVSIGESSAEHRGESLGYRQLRLRIDARSCRVVSCYDAWQRGGLSFDVHEGEGGLVRIDVRHGERSDRWLWRVAADAEAPSELVLQRDGAAILRVDVDDQVPRP